MRNAVLATVRLDLARLAMFLNCAASSDRLRSPCGDISKSKLPECIVFTLSMLNATFQRLLRGAGPDLEAKLWRKGILSWEEYEDREAVQRSLFLDSTSRSGIFGGCRHALKKEDAAFFAVRLDRREHYRIPLSFPRRTLFLDIETTGLSRYYDYITLVGWSYRGKYDIYLRGQDDGPLRAALQDAQAVVTFNGSLFDLPFLKAFFEGLALPPVHIDLRFLGRRVGLSGGQKEIETELGFSRPPHLREIRGESAPILWHRYRRGDIAALRLLIEYNHCDIEGMKFIFDYTISKLLAKQRVPTRIRAQVPQLAVEAKIRWLNGRAKGKGHGIRLLPHPGPSGPAITLAALPKRVRAESSLRIVGIDLTGSEQRPTGFCLLEGDMASTRLIATDEDIVAATIRARPHIVSIDSPLSLPKGRTSVSDDDPGREEFGIMRYCERMLKKRGINVYPALIPSMQRLTARGIQMATRLRAVGLPVIESYPGAAQDIMGIPRKRASLDMLQQGLAEFGVRGAFQTEQVSHDELDAITAAIVGVFLWSGKFESLGSEDEEALIIPDLKRDASVWNTRRVVGVSGRLAAGKTTISRYLETRGFHYGRYSMVLENLLAPDGRKTHRTELQALGERVHHERGQRWLGRRLLEALPPTGDIVVDGLRFPDDHSFLAEAFGPGFFHVHVEAEGTTRENRFAHRERGGVSFQQADGHPVEQNVESLRPLAHAVVRNEGDISTLQATMNALVLGAFGESACQ